MRVLRIGLAEVLFSAGCIYLPPSHRLTGLLAGTAAAALAAAILGLRAKRMRWGLDAGNVRLHAGLFLRKTTLLRRRDIQAVRIWRTPLLEAFGLAAVSLRLPGRYYWLDGLLPEEAEAFL